MFLRAGVQTQGIVFLHNSCLLAVDTVPTKVTAVLVQVLHRLCSLQPFLGGSCSVNQISGKISMGEEVLATVDGHWVRTLILPLCPFIAALIALSGSSVSIQFCLLPPATRY